MYGRQRSPPTKEENSDNELPKQNGRVTRMIARFPLRPRLNIENAINEPSSPTPSCQENIKRAQIDSKQNDEENSSIVRNGSKSLGERMLIKDTSNYCDLERKNPNCQVNKRTSPTFANDESTSSSRAGFSKHPPYKMENNKNEAQQRISPEQERRIDEAMEKLNRKKLVPKEYSSRNNYKSNGQPSHYYDRQKKNPSHQVSQSTFQEANTRTLSRPANSKYSPNNMESRKNNAMPSILPELNGKVAEAMMKLNITTAETKGYRPNIDLNPWNKYVSNEKFTPDHDQQRWNSNYRNNSERLEQRRPSAPMNERLCKKLEALREQSSDDEISSTFEKSNIPKTEDSLYALTSDRRSEEYSNHRRSPTLHEAKSTWKEMGAFYSNHQSPPTGSSSLNDMTAHNTIGEVPILKPDFHRFKESYDAYQELAKDLQQSKKLRRPKDDKP